MFADVATLRLWEPAASCIIVFMLYPQVSIALIPTPTDIYVRWIFPKRP